MAPNFFEQKTTSLSPMFWRVSGSDLFLHDQIFSFPRLGLSPGLLLGTSPLMEEVWPEGIGSEMRGDATPRRDLVNADGALIRLCPRRPEGAHSGGEDPGSRSQGSSTMDGSQFGLLTGARRRCGSFRWTGGGPAFSGPLDECVQLLRSPIVPGRRNRDYGRRFRGRAIANSLALRTGTRSSYWQT